MVPCARDCDPPLKALASAKLADGLVLRWRHRPRLGREKDIGTRAAVHDFGRKAASTAAFRGGVTGAWGCFAREGAVSPLPKAPGKRET